ncbi:M60 family metallopeptidase [Plantibacter flavus]|uniref:M60 family metallopeptidase n=1 Tax=Plantibacter flavus TaxID=150123 RepID=UPI003F17A8DF
MSPRVSQRAHHGRFTFCITALIATAILVPTAAEAASVPNIRSAVSPSVARTTILAERDVETSVALQVESPAAGGEFAADATGLATPVFSGIATAGAQVRVVTQWGDHVGEVTADAQGRWSILWEKSLLPARYVGGHTIQSVGGRDVDRVRYDFTVNHAAVTPLEVETPALNGEVFIDASGLATPVFSGLSTPEAQVRVVTQWGDHVGEVAADAQGRWSITWDKSLRPARYSGGHTIQSVGGRDVGRVPYDFAVVRPAMRPLELLTPVEGTELVADAGGSVTPEFTGHATPHADIRIEAADGHVVGATRAGADGAWSALWDEPIGVGRYEDVRAVQTVGGVEIDRVSTTISVRGQYLPGPVVSEQSSVVDVVALISAGEAQAREGRSYAHSDLQPTGRYVEKGEDLTVTVPGDMNGAALVVGLYGSHAVANGGASVGHSSHGLRAGVNTITADRDGMVYLQSETSAGAVTVAGGLPVPTYLVGRTDRATFDAQLAAWSSTPYVSLVGDRIFGDFQRRIVVEAVKGQDLDVRIASWDTVVQLTDDAYGLAKSASGVGHRYDHRMYVSNPDTGAGYASATNSRITFQVDTGAGKDLLAGGFDNWGLWHEIGHTYQPSIVRDGGGLGEVSVNISALYVQERLGYPSRVDSAGIRNGFAAFRQTPIGERAYNKISDLFLKVFMFDQLRRAFGDDFYAQLAQEIRMQDARGYDRAYAGHDRFIWEASRIADRDLTPFFREWGLPVEGALAEELAAFPKLQTPIWENDDRLTDVIERQVPSLVVPSGVLGPVGTVQYGQSVLDPDDLSVTGLAAGTIVEDVSVVYSKVGAQGARIAATIVDSLGNRNVLVGSAEARAVDVVEFDGISDRLIATIALDAGVVRVNPGDGRAAHDYFGGQEYVSAELRSPRGDVLASAIVQGQDNGSVLRKAFEGVLVPNGSTLVVAHAEPKNRLKVWTGGVQAPRSDSRERSFRVVDGSFVPMQNEAAFHGIGENLVATVGLHDGVLLVDPGSSTAAHPYFGGQVYVSAELRSADGAVLAAASVDGNATGAVMRDALHGVSVPEGSTLVVTHQEPTNRLIVRATGELLAGSDAKERTYRVVGGAFVPLD